MVAITCASLVGGVARAQDKPQLIVYTENYPPFNFEREDGSVGGLATEKVRQILDAAGVLYTIQVLPWARAMNAARTKDNALIFTITRTPRREYGFDWIALIAESNFHVYARADETRSITSEALKAGVFTASCVSGDLACELLIWAGVPTKNIIPIAKEGTGDFRMVVAGRADIYISDYSANKKLRLAEGYDPALTKPVMRLDSRAGFYLAAGLKVPLEVRKTIKEAYESLRASGQYQLVHLDGPEGAGG